MTDNFGFEQCAKIVPYLYKLGISHIYFSPFLQAESGSKSGYDMVDSQNINIELGGEKGLENLSEEIKPYMGQILDIVPNHLSIQSDKNKLWNDVLKYGRKSQYGHFFDINWGPPQKKLTNKVLLAVLGEHYENELKNRNIQIKRINDDFFATYYSFSFPINDASAEKIKKGTIDETDKEIEKVNNDAQLLDEVLNNQFYFLSHWEAADQEINYRRFFTINHLLGLRIEEEDVFEYTHKLIFEMLEEGQLDGVRIDHIDGLRDPAEYLNRIKRKAPEKWIITEKILGPEEPLPKKWPIHGTTGYDFLNAVNGLFVNPSAREPLSNLYRQLTGETRQFNEMLYKKKLLTLQKSFGGETKRLIKILEEISMSHEKYRDLTIGELEEGLSIIIGYFPVYRTYINNLNKDIDPKDRNIIEQTISLSREKNPQVHQIVWDFFGDLLTAKMKGREELEFILRFQQLTGPVMAKGAEDTAFYCYNDLISLNEVGGSPGRFGTSIEEFHSFCSRMQADWPMTMLTTSTHDTKRGEDVRMRINMISDVPGQWQDNVKQWYEQNKKYHTGNLPNANTEYFLYQTLLGCWPIEINRLKEYMIKAAREEKVHTSWTKVKGKYEEALESFIENICKDNEFINSLESFISLILKPARISSLSQILIKYTAPGIPDLYQGAELWEIVLVDPDNRRAIDYEFRQNIFTQMEKMSSKEALEHLDTGLTKMFVLHQCLKVRRENQECFGADSSYTPLEISGAKAGNIIGFRRNERIITIAPRLLLGLQNDWQDTLLKLPAGRWTNVFSSQTFENVIEIKNLLSDFPLALLIKEE